MITEVTTSLILKMEYCFKFAPEVDYLKQRQYVTSTDDIQYRLAIEHIVIRYNW